MFKLIYRMLKGAERRLLFLARYVKFLGFRKGLRFCLGNRRGKTLEVSPPGAGAPVTLRARTSDIPAFEDTFIFGHYGIEFDRDPEVIVDAGAHIGLVSALFATRYPDAKIIAIEPEPGNFEILSKNVKAYPNVVPLQRALWHREGKLQVV